MDAGAGTVSIFFGDGLGAFARLSIITIGAGCLGLGFGDSNGDSVLDLHITRPGYGEILRFAGLDGTAFSQPETLYQQVISLSLRVQDVTADGSADLVFTDSFKRTVHVLQFDGTGAVAADDDYPVGTSPSDIEIGDVTGDGVSDLVVTNSAIDDLPPGTSATVLTGTASGLFRTQGELIVGSGAWDAEIVDVDGKGPADVVVLSQVSAILSTVFGDEGIGMWPYLISVGTAAPTQAVFVDLEHDGSDDLVVAGDVPGLPETVISLLKTDTSGAFSPRQSITLGPIILDLVPTALPGSAGFGLVVSETGVDDRLSIFPVNQQGLLDPPSHVLLNRGAIAVAAGDVNGDQIMDLALADAYASTVTLQYGNQAGQFTLGPTLVTGTHPWDVAVVDMNHDGVNDIVVANATGSTIVLLKGLGGGTFVSSEIATGLNFPVAISCADINGDGALDVVASNRGRYTTDDAFVSVHVQSGDGTFREAQRVPLGHGGNRVAGRTYLGAPHNGGRDLFVCRPTDNTVSIVSFDPSGQVASVRHVGVFRNPNDVVPVRDSAGERILVVCSDDKVLLELDRGEPTGLAAGTMTLERACGKTRIMWSVNDPLHWASLWLERGTAADGQRFQELPALTGSGEAWDVQPAGPEEYSLVGIDRSGFRELVAVASLRMENRPVCLDVRPNPFRSSLSLSFEAAPGTSAHLDIFSLSGRRVRKLEGDTWLTVWDGLDENGRPCPRGMYIVKVTVDGRTETRKVVKY